MRCFIADLFLRVLVEKKRAGVIKKGENAFQIYYFFAAVALEHNYVFGDAISYFCNQALSTEFWRVYHVLKSRSCNTVNQSC